MNPLSPLNLLENMGQLPKSGLRISLLRKILSDDGSNWLSQETFPSKKRLVLQKVAQQRSGYSSALSLAPGINLLGLPSLLIAKKQVPHEPLIFWEKSKFLTASQVSITKSPRTLMGKRHLAHFALATWLEKQR
jgi:hypothetical protein